MEKVFGAVLHLSLIGSYTVLLVVLLRFLMLKVLHCSRKLIYGLWLLVFLNFCVPTGLFHDKIKAVFEKKPLRQERPETTDLGITVPEKGIRDHPDWSSTSSGGGHWPASAACGTDTGI